MRERTASKMSNRDTSEATTAEHLDWSRAKEIFAGAIDKPSDSRLAFIESTCGAKSAMGAMVLRLLASHADATDFLVEDTQGVGSTQATDRAAASESARHRSPRMPAAVGPYEIIEKIGEGGHGTVYRARQHAPIEREIAIKILKPGLESEDLIARFADERRFLARMDHPDIVKILDAGGTPEGRLFVAMELVRGIPLAKFAEEKDLSLRHRVALVGRIARAVHHAHQRAIVHRDLKPTNILVAEEDGVLRPRIIDFGIARALADDDPGNEHEPRTVRAIGTPRYMSPEQAGAGGTVDTRTDVYALGVILCELLTGKTPRPPSSSEDTRSGPIAATPPSRLARSDAAPVATPSALRGDLDRIVLKCVAWDPEDRYASVSEFADDLARYLDGRPVLAAPPSVWYTTRKFAARHKAAVALGAAAVLLLCAALALAVMGWNRALDQTRVAESALAESGRQTERARFVTRFLVEDMISAADPDAKPGGELTAADLLDAADRNAAERFAGDPELLADIKGRIGIAYARLGRDREAVAALDEAIAILADRTAGSNALGSKEDREQSLAWEFERSLAMLMIPGRHKESGAAIRDIAQRTREQLGSDHPLAMRASLRASEYIEDAEQRSATVRDIERRTRNATYDGNSLRMLALRFYAGTLSRAGETKQAAEAFRSAYDLSRSALGVDHTRSIELEFKLAEALVDAGRAAEGIETMRDTLRRAQNVLGPAHGTLTGMQRRAVGVFLRAGAADEAIGVAEAFAENAANQYGEDSIPHVSAHQELGRALIEAGRPDDGLALLERILPLREKQWGDDHAQTAYTVRAIADACFELGRWHEAEAFAARAMASLPASSPSRYLAGATRVRALRTIGDRAQADRVLSGLLADARRAGADEATLSKLDSLVTDTD